MLRRGGAPEPQRARATRYTPRSSRGCSAGTAWGCALPRAAAGRCSRASSRNGPRGACRPRRRVSSRCRRRECTPLLDPTGRKGGKGGNLSCLSGLSCPRASVQMASQLRRVAQLLFRARLDLANPLAGKVDQVAALLKRPRLVVFESVTKPHHFPLLAIEIEERRRKVVEIGPMDQFVFDRRVLLGKHVAQLRPAVLAATVAAPDWIVERDVVRPGMKEREQLGRKRERACLIGKRVHHRLPDPPHRVRDELDV